MFAAEVKWYLVTDIEQSYIANVKDKSSMLSDHSLLFLENCRERHIKNVKRINSLKLYSIGNLYWWSELGLREQKLMSTEGLKKAAEVWR